MKYLFLPLFLLSQLACQQRLLIRGTYPEPAQVSAAAERQEDIAELIAPYKARLDREMDQVIGRNPTELPKQKPESGLTNWLADLLHTKAEEYYGAPIDFAYQNYGGIRVPSLPAGQITRRHIYELMPFDNRLTVMELDGPATLQLISAMAGQGGAPVSSALRFKVIDGRPVDIMIKGRIFDESRSYLVALPDYIANGGGNSDYLVGRPREDLSIFVRDAIIEFLQEQATVQTRLDGRIQLL